MWENANCSYHTWTLICLILRKSKCCFLVVVKLKRFENDHQVTTTIHQSRKVLLLHVFDQVKCGEKCQKVAQGTKLVIRGGSTQERRVVFPFQMVCNMVMRKYIKTTTADRKQQKHNAVYQFNSIITMCFFPHFSWYLELLNGNMKWERKKS